MRSRILKFTATMRSFLRSNRGNVAMMFAIALIPLMIGAAAGLDFARGMLVRQQMTEALDAAALAVGSSTGLNQTSAQTLAQQYFNANFTVDTSAYGVPTVAIPSGGYNSAGSVQLTATDTMPTVLMKLVGINSLPISATSTVVWGQTKLWVALVLDNSGSMQFGDSSGSKMAALKNASQQLLTVLQNAAATPGDVQVSVVPFVKTVNVGTGNVNASWIDFTSDWGAPPVTNQTTDTHQTDNDILRNSDPLKSFGPGDSCPYTSSIGYLCNANPTNNSNCSPNNSSGCVSTIPSSGTYKGYICPSMHKSGTQDGLGYHFYNGCWVGSTWDNTYTTISTGSSASCNGHTTGTGGNCSCSGSGSSMSCKTKNYPHTWVANSTSTWTGCVMDREWTSAAGADYDESNTTPGTGYTKFPAENTVYCGPATITTLGYNWTNISTQINNMTPYGSTNQAIGIEHGWQTITPGSPYGAPSVPANTSRYMIILSDGKNTQDRWWGDGSTENTTADGYIDQREEATCDKAKADGVIIYTILLDIPAGSESPSAPLQYCASDSSKYFVLTSTTAIVTTFNQIAQEITAVRVSR